MITLYIKITWLAPGVEIDFCCHIIFEICVSKVSLGMPGHDWSYAPKLKWAIFIDMLHTQDQLYKSFSFWYLKALTAFLGMPGHAWSYSCKIT